MSISTGGGQLLNEVPKLTCGNRMIDISLYHILYQCLVGQITKPSGPYLNNVNVKFCFGYYKNLISRGVQRSP